MAAELQELVDVLVVGAGPTGLSLGCQLARYGVDFEIIDQKASTTPYSKAIGVHARTLEIYDQISLADPLIELGEKALGSRLIVDGQIRGEIDFTGIGAGLTPHPYVLIVEQGKHERLLEEHLNSTGNRVKWNTRLEFFRQDDECVTVEVSDKDGVSRTLRARYIVACDGAKSSIRHSLGLKFEGSTFDRLFYVADVELDWKFGRSSIFAFLMRRNLLVAFAMAGDRQFRIVGTFPEEFGKDEGDVLYEEIEDQIRRDSRIEFDITRVNWFSTYRVHTRYVESFRGGRVFLAGDAAHIHTPAGAQGMNTGIQDGYNLAWKLAAVLNHGANDALLDSYDEERLPNARALTQTTDRLFALAAGPHPFAAFVRMRLFPLVAGFALRLDLVRKIVFPRLSQIAINYRNSSLSEHTKGFKVRAGDRMPWFENEGKSIYEHLRSPLFHLVVFIDGKTSVPMLPAELMRRWADRIDSHVFEIDQSVATAFGRAKAFYLILRPDNHIGLISEDFSSANIERYLSRFE